MEFLDPSLDDTTSPCKIMRCMQVALLCVQENSADRPSMLEVDSLLKNEAAAIVTPKTPGFSVKNMGMRKIHLRNFLQSMMLQFLNLHQDDDMEQNIVVLNYK